MRGALPRSTVVSLLLVIAACDREPPVVRTSVDGASPGAPVASPATTPDRRGSAPIAIPTPSGLNERPKLALYVNNPWALVLGSEIPSIVVYDDGRVIRLLPEPARIVEGKLTGSVTELVSTLESALLDEPAQASISHATDQPTVSVLLETSRGWILRSVYGLNGDGTPSIPSQGHAKPSRRFSSALARIRTLPVSATRPYEPAEVQILLWGFEHSKLQPRVWPSTIPAPKNALPPAKGVLRHVVDGKLAGEVDRFIAGLEPNQAVLLAGKKWSIQRRVLVPADAHLGQVRSATRRAYVESVTGKR